MYPTKIFSENVFVVSPGPAEDTLWNLGIGWHHYPPIRRAHASFSHRDLGKDRAELLPIRDIGGARHSEKDWANTPYFKQRSHLESFDPKTDRSYHAAQSKLTALWTEKYWNLRQLPLEEMTLDFTECYGEYNEWLGIFAAKNMQIKVPTAAPGLRVIAPYDGQRLYIRRLLSDNLH